MENQKSKKTLVIISVLVIAIIAVIIVVVLSSKENNETNPQNETGGLQGEIENVMDEVNETAKENSSVKVGEYVIPDETDFICEEVDGGVTLKSYIGEETTIEIPEQINGKDVVEIMGGTFSNIALVGVKIPDTVKKIEENAFYFQTALVEVIFGKNVEVIEEAAFEGCTALKTIKLNEGLKTIGGMAFALTSSLENITLPTSLETIENGAFCMSGLEKITIPGAVKAIEKQAFGMCKSLETVILEDGVSRLGDGVFKSCDKLTRVDIPSSVNEFEFAVFGRSDNVIIHAPEGSKAQEYAQQEEIEFEAK